MAITWDFIRQLAPAATPGSTVLYYDMTMQAFYIADGAIYTKTGVVLLDQWQQNEYTEAVQVSDAGYSYLDIEHHFNDAVFGTSYHDDSVVFLVYEYRVDTTEFSEMGLIQHQPNNSIKVATIELSKAGEARLRDSLYSLFSPGTAIDLKLQAGTDEPVVVERLAVSAVSWDEVRSKTTITARNTVALKLLNQTFDDQNTFSGTVTEIVTAVLASAGIAAILMDANATSTAVTFAADQAILDGLSDFCSLYGWYIDTDNLDNILVGTDAFIQQYKTIVIHEFIRDDEVFSRYLDRGDKHIYTRVCVRRKGGTPLQIYGTVPAYAYDVPSKRTLYKDVAETVTDVEMEAIRDALISNMQYSGVEETFTAAFRPELHIGDGVLITAKDATVFAGIIIDVQHVFGHEGYFTQFSVCCGGTMANTPPTLTSLYVTRLGHLDRKQRITQYLTSSDRR